MSGLIDKLFGVDAWVVYVVATLLVFLEDAVFLGVVLPAETVAVVGGVIASKGSVDVFVLMALVTAAAIVGDSVGYLVGRRFGPRLLQVKILAKHQDRVADAQDFLRRRGGAAVFLGRFVAFFRAMIPGLAGMAAMPYGKFFLYNAAGGLIWGPAVVLIGYFGADSYQKLESEFGKATAILVAVAVIAGLVVWRVRARRKARA